MPAAFPWLWIKITQNFICKAAVFYKWPDVKVPPHKTWSPEKQVGAPCWHSDHINRWIKTESSEFPLQGNLRWCHSSRGSCQINNRTSSIMTIVARKPLGRSPQQREHFQCRLQPDPGLWGAMIRAEDVLAQFNGRLYGPRHGIHPETTQFLLHVKHRLRSWILTVIKLS